MILKDHSEIESESDRSKDDEMPLLDNCSDRDVKYLIEGELLWIWYVFNVQIKKYDVKQQRDNIFHIICHISNKV